MEIFLDIDGVLADFMEGATKLHGRENPYLLEENMGKYHINQILEIDARTFYAPMEEEFWAGLPLMHDAHMIVDILEQRYGHNICLLSTPTLNLGCYNGKVQWIRKHFPQFSRDYLIGPKKWRCAHEHALLIDDSEENVEKFRKRGNAILLPRAWNKLHHLGAVTHLKDQLSFYF